MFKDCLEENRYALSVQGLERMKSSDFAVLLASRLKPCSALFACCNLSVHVCCTDGNASELVTLHVEELRLRNRIKCKFISLIFKVVELKSEKRVLRVKVMID